MNAKQKKAYRGLKTILAGTNEENQSTALNVGIFMAALFEADSPELRALRARFQDRRYLGMTQAFDELDKTVTEIRRLSK